MMDYELEYLHWQNRAECQELMLRTYRRVLDFYGENHQCTAEMVLRVAAIYHNQMRYDESLPWYQRAYRAYRQAVPMNHTFLKRDR